MLNNLINIDNVLVNKEILETKFTCNLDRCKGACCTMESDFGAPLLADEIIKINEILPKVKKYLPERQVEEIETNGFYFEIEGDLMISAIDKQDCVFVYYHDDIAKCAIEKVYYEEDTDFIKPISCHLFPIRINQFGGDILKYEVYNECSSAVALGKITEIPLSEFCEDALKRKYGIDWYEKLKRYK
ncbi:MAG: DUF3109 family protein [Melioribacteraceae bacterium]|nr:DUF3109 family protein [Melioribacteraceae bacterium]